MTEAEIKQLLAEDHPTALERIYEFAGQDLYGYLAGLTASKHDAEELLNDLFLRIVDKREKLAAAANLKAYLFRMASNLAYDRMRHQKKHTRALEDYAVILESDEAAEISGEEVQNLNRALISLPLEQREAVLMKFYFKKTFLEIAESLGVSENTISSRYRYAMQKLKSFMEGAQ